MLTFTILAGRAALYCCDAALFVLLMLFEAFTDARILLCMRIGELMEERSMRNALRQPLLCRLDRHQYRERESNPRWSSCTKCGKVRYSPIVPVAPPNK